MIKKECPKCRGTRFVINVFEYDNCSNVVEGWREDGEFECTRCGWQIRVGIIFRDGKMDMIPSSKKEG